MLDVCVEEDYLLPKYFSILRLFFVVVVVVVVIVVVVFIIMSYPNKRVEEINILCMKETAYENSRILIFNLKGKKIFSHTTV